MYRIFARQFILIVVIHLLIISKMILGKTDENVVLVKAIIAASSLGYAIANGISLYSYVKYKKEKNNRNHKNNNNNYKKSRQGLRVPEVWSKVILVFAFVNIPLFLLGLVYLNSLDSGWLSTIVGVAVLVIYLPLYKYSEKEKNITNSTKVS